MTVKDIRARNLAEVRVSQSRVSNKLSVAQRESLVVQLSTEATRQSRQGEGSRPEQILAGLSRFMMSVSIGEERPQKRVTRRRVEWSPTAAVGQVKEGLSVMGRLNIIDVVEEQPGRTTDFLAMSISSSGGSANLSISVGSNGSNSPRIEGGESLHNLMKNGLVADGLKALLDGDRQGATQSGAKSLTVRTNGTGKQRVLSLTRGGQLNRNTRALGAFQVLDKKPILKKSMDMSNIYHDFSGRQDS